MLVLPLRAAEKITIRTNDEKNPEMEITEAQGLALAGSLLKEGNLDQARPLFTRLAKSEDKDIRSEALFELGMIFMVEKDYEYAIRFFLAVLGSNPDLTRVRLELARAYFLDRNFDEAAFQFRLVKGDSTLPPEVVENVDKFLEEIRRNKSWSVSSAFGIAPDTNRNNAAGDDVDCILTIFGTMQCPAKDSGVGLKLNTTFNHYARFTRDFGWRSTLGAYLTDYKGGRYDDYMLYAATGPRYVFGMGEVSFQPLFYRRWLYGEGYNKNMGARLDTSWDLKSRAYLSTGVQFARTSYDDEGIEEYYRGNTFSWYMNPRYLLSQKSFVGFELGLGVETLAKDYNSSHSYTYGLNYFNEFPLGFALDIGFSTTSARYDAKHDYPIVDTVSMSDEDFYDCIRHSSLVFYCPLTRRDNTYNYYIALISNKLNFEGLFPSLRYSYLDRRSNVPMYEFDRHRVELLATYRF
jgi:tetratricopeptide (TPR) repeat protein